VPRLIKQKAIMNYLIRQMNRTILDSVAILLYHYNKTLKILDKKNHVLSFIRSPTHKKQTMKFFLTTDAY
jgi:hypothetical protein